MKSYFTRLFPIFILLVAFTLRLWHLGTNELWFDETASTFIANKPLDELIRYTAQAQREHPPFYYVLLHFWISLTGESEFTIRFLSVIFSMLFTTTLARLAYRLNGKKFALITLAFAAIAPFSILYAQEARMYSLVMWLASVLIWSTEGILNSRKGAFPLFLLTSIIGMATSYFFAPLILAADLILLWHRPPLIKRWWYGWLALHLLGVGTIALLFALPGPRSTFFILLNGKADSLVWYNKLSLALQDLGGGRTSVSSLNLPTVLLTWGFILFGMWRWHARHLKDWLLFGCFFIIFVLVANLPVLDGRYFSASVPVLYLWISVTILWVIRQRWLVRGILLPLLLWTVCWPLWQHYHEDLSYFGAALLHASSATRSGKDTLVLLEPDAWPMVDFYSRRLSAKPPLIYLPIHYETVKITSDDIQERIKPILDNSKRVILGPVEAKNRDPDFLVEHYLLEHAFAASREFWPDSTMVAVFVSPSDLEAGPAQLDFGKHVRLVQSHLSALDVRAGGEIAVRLQWTALSNALPRFAVSLQLQDEIGQVWATQQTEPCNGWCASSSWPQDELVTDNRALLIPSDLPAGSYALILRLDAENGPVGDPQQLGVVEVRSGQVNIGENEVNEPFTTLADIEISDLSATPQALQIRQEITWKAKFRPTVNASPNWQLMWHLIQDDTIKQSWLVPASRVSYPSEAWEPNQVIRGQGRLELAGDLTAGKYDLQVQIMSSDAQALSSQLAVTQITLMDRDHHFDLPQIEPAEKLEIAWQQGVQLYAGNAPTDGITGQAHPIRLIWQAQGPTDRNYKIFVHLRDESNNTVAQQDILPANGQAPSNSWVENEVIIDEIDLLLPSDLPVGSYKIMIGFYHEASGERLWRTEDQGNEFELTSIKVENP